MNADSNSNDLAPNADAPLLIFDSGFGGLSVLSEIQAALPNAPIIYAADHAFLPYGDKSDDEIAARVPALLGRLVEEYNPRLAVIACNTACTIALPQARAVLVIPIVGTVPAIKPAAERSKSKVIGLLGTEATIRQPYIDQLHADHASDCTLLRHAAPQLVLAAEAKLRGEPINPEIFTAAIEGLTSQPSGEHIDQIILGCTHFPLLEPELSDAAKGVGFVDGAAGIARRVGVLTQGQDWPDKPCEGVFISTGEQTEGQSYANMLRQYSLTQIKAIS